MLLKFLPIYRGRFFHLPLVTECSVISSIDITDSADTLQVYKHQIYILLYTLLLEERKGIFFHSFLHFQLEGKITGESGGFKDFSMKRGEEARRHFGKDKIFQT